MKTRKELKEAYRQMTFPMGVFQIRNVSNNKVLIDHSTDMASKWNRHKMELKFGKHRNYELQQDWNKNGEGSFVFEVLSELKPRVNEAMDPQKELTALKEMVIEEMSLEDGLFC